MQWFLHRPLKRPFWRNISRLNYYRFSIRTSSHPQQRRLLTWLLQFTIQRTGTWFGRCAGNAPFALEIHSPSSPLCSVSWDPDLWGMHQVFFALWFLVGLNKWGTLGRDQRERARGIKTWYLLFWLFLVGGPMSGSHPSTKGHTPIKGPPFSSELSLSVSQ